MNSFYESEFGKQFYVAEGQFSVNLTMLNPYDFKEICKEIKVESVLKCEHQHSSQ